MQRGHAPLDKGRAAVQIQAMSSKTITDTGERRVAAEMQACLERLFPLPRCLAGEANRATLRGLQAIAPLTIQEIPSGTAVHDWTVPPEWSVQEAWIADARGRRLVDFADHNLHLVSHSCPVDAYMDWPALQPHVHTHPELPEAIPYRTSYYQRSWGFCVTQAQAQALAAAPGPLQVRIDSALTPGAMSVGELLLPGRRAQEILLSAYICHPSMANDSLSGAVLLAFIGRHLASLPDRQYSYRLVWVPETVGAVAYAATHAEAMRRVEMGLVVTTVGGPGPLGYKRTFDDRHPLNAMIESVLRERGDDFKTYPFDIHGSDERQWSSPGLRIPTATICKDRYYEYAQYHSSLDDLRLVNGAQMAESLDAYVRLIGTLESRELYRNTVGAGEVMLSRHDLYPKSGGAQRPELGGRSELDLILWLLWHCDGHTSLQDIAVALDVPLARLRELAQRLSQKGVLAHV